jgi:cyclopropane fatty-acyl-phospholipid synthase-like methyltransferase
MKSNYFIKTGYQPNPRLSYDNSVIDSAYWTTKRIRQTTYNNYYTYKYVQNILKINKLASVLDVGCGIGLKLMNMISPYVNTIYGIDSPGAVTYCKEKYPQAGFYGIDFEL